MTIFELVSVIGLFAGPVVAVIITLWHQQRSNVRERRLGVARSLLDTHHDAGERDYSSAIRLVPVEFRRDPQVLEAWRSFMDNVTTTPSAENVIVHNNQFLDRKFRLIFEVCRSVGIKLSENEIRTSVYEAQAYANAKQLQRESQQALVRIANSMGQLPPQTASSVPVDKAP